MPRRRSSFSRSSRTNTRNTTRAAPTNQKSQVPQQRAQGGFLSNMMGSIVTGMGFGAGSEVGHQAMRGLFGGGQTQEQPQVQENTYQTQQQPNVQQNSCQLENSNFVECLKFNSNNINQCQELLDNLKQCEQKFN